MTLTRLEHFVDVLDGEVTGASMCRSPEYAVFDQKCRHECSRPKEPEALTHCATCSTMRR